MPLDPVSLKAGHDFEDYVGERFSDRNFQLLNNRSDRLTATHFPREAQDPDLEWLDLRSQREFAVECKYRRTWMATADGDRFVTLGRRGKLSCYRRYAARTGQPVFVVFGVGGDPTAPDEIYIVPLAELTDDIVLHSIVARFRSAHPRGYFAFEAKASDQALCQLPQSPPEQPRVAQPRAIDAARSHRRELAPEPPRGPRLSSAVSAERRPASTVRHPSPPPQPNNAAIRCLRVTGIAATVRVPSGLGRCRGRFDPDRMANLASADAFSCAGRARASDRTRCRLGITPVYISPRQFSPCIGVS